MFQASVLHVYVLDAILDGPIVDPFNRHLERELPQPLSVSNTNVIDICLELFMWHSQACLLVYALRLMSSGLYHRQTLNCHVPIRSSHGSAELKLGGTIASANKADRISLPRSIGNS